VNASTTRLGLSFESRLCDLAVLAVVRQSSSFSPCLNVATIASTLYFSTAAKHLPWSYQF
jgi:hypothetical protein